MGWQDDPVVSQAAPQGAAWQNDPIVEQQPAQATAGERTTAFAAGANRGFANILGMPADALLNVTNLTKAGIEAGVLATGNTPPTWLDPTMNRASIPLTSDWIKARLGSTVDIPRTDDPASRYLAAAGEGAAGASIGGGTSVPNTVRSVVSGTSGALGSQFAKEHGAGPVGQVAAGLAAGMTPQVLEEIGRQVVHMVPGLIRPLTRSGQQQIAADVMGEQAIDPRAAANNMRAAQEVVPGSARTTGEASRDIGLLALEKGVRGRNTAAFGERLSEQNAARQTELADLAGTRADISSASQVRDQITGPMRDAALQNPVGRTIGAPTQIVQDRIDTILASPAGQRETVSKSMQWAKELIGDQTDPVALYEIRKDLQLAQRGRLQPSSPNAPNASTLAQARGQLGEVVDTLDNAIESAAPGFKAYLDRYKDLSKPIDQMRVMQEIQRRSQLTTADVTTQQQFLGSAGFSRALDAAIEKSGQKLTPDQMRRLEAIRTDLQYGQAINSSLVKAPGSDTFQNLSIAQVIGAGTRVGNHPVIRTLTKPLEWVYRLAGTDEGINEVMANAMLDPKLAASLLDRATPKTVSQFSARLRSSLAGTTASQLGNTVPPKEEQSNRR